MNHLTWKITGRTLSATPPENWRDQLAARLGQRPRRIGMLAELALYGALDCLDGANETTLAWNDVLRVCSFGGSMAAISQVLKQNLEDLPMPFSFLQSQTSQILPTLAAALNWQGDASVILARNAMDIALLSCHQAGRNGMLLGWVEEAEPCQSYWLRLVPCDAPAKSFEPVSNFDKMIVPSTRYWQLEQAGVAIKIA